MDRKGTRTAAEHSSIANDEMKSNSLIPSFRTKSVTVWKYNKIRIWMILSSIIIYTEMF